MKLFTAASSLVLLILILCACGNPYISQGVQYSGEINEASNQYTRYLSNGDYWGTFREEYHNFKVAPDTAYTVTLGCAEGDYAILDDESGGDFDMFGSNITIANGMGIGTAVWIPGKSGMVTLRIYCREEYIPLVYTILIE